MATERKIEIFVPGRICLFGEHSDWAASYRRVNSKIEKGYTIICGTNQGLYATAVGCEDRFIYRRTDSEGLRDSIDLPLEPKGLLKVAEEGGVWSYIAGVAYQILTHYHVGGLEIDNFRTDLPVKKGLSSSAAACVLVARAFNRLYDLKLTVRGEMDMAYRGEVTTPSRCGRMDQGCAFGGRPVLMTFDGDTIDVMELHVARDLHYVVVDLKSAKDTIKILSDLNRAYPFAQTETHRKVQEHLGGANKQVVSNAVRALEAGDVNGLGDLMNVAQQTFDAAMIPACPDQLRAPVLHSLLSHPAVLRLVWGGKGVGSQGDGAAQLLARDAESQANLIQVLEREMGLTAYPLTIRRVKGIQKAVITAAGLGTRLFPFTKAVRKEFMPVVDEFGLASPLILKHVEELLEAGIEKIGVVVQREEQWLFDKLFKEPVRQEVLEKLPINAREAAARLERAGPAIEYIYQEHPGGLGEAALLGAGWAGDVPFLLVLGDHVFTTMPGAPSCAEQVLRAYDAFDHTMIGLARTPLADVHRFGCVTGSWEKEDEVLSISLCKEKPTQEYAREYLQVPGRSPEEYLSVFGLYVVTPGLAAVLESARKTRSDQNEELQLTDALEEYRRNAGLLGLVLRGSKQDIGSPQGATAYFRQWRDGT